MTFLSIVKRAAFLCMLAVCCWSTGTAYAGDDDFPERPSPPRLVNDYAALLNPSQAGQLEQKLTAYSDSTSTQIAIVTMNEIGDYEAGDYAQRLADKWGVGVKGKNNGLLILVVKETHKVFIATGYGMEGDLPDALVKRLIETVIVPNFKQGDYYAGLDQVTDSIMQIMSGVYKGEPGGGKGKRGTMIFFFIVLAAIILLSFISRGGGGGFLAGGMLGGGLGGFSSRGYSSGGGGGGFGGFGGGGFGGGGAGGSW